MPPVAVPKLIARARPIFPPAARGASLRSIACTPSLSPTGGRWRLRDAALVTARPARRGGQQEARRQASARASAGWPYRHATTSSGGHASMKAYVAAWHGRSRVTQRSRAAPVRTSRKVSHGPRRAPGRGSAVLSGARAGGSRREDGRANRAPRRIGGTAGLTAIDWPLPRRCYGR